MNRILKNCGVNFERRVFMLLAVYAGVKLFGVGGIVKGPLALIVIYEIWKTELPA